MTNRSLCSQCNKIKNSIEFRGKLFCYPCYDEIVCFFCDPPALLDECQGHSIKKNPSNRFMTNKEFTDGIRFEYESERHLPPGSRPAHVRRK